MGILHLWFGGCCGELGSGTPKPKNMEFRELGGLCQLLCSCSSERYPCEVGEYKDLFGIADVFIPEHLAKAKCISFFL